MHIRDLIVRALIACSISEGKKEGFHVHRRYYNSSAYFVKQVEYTGVLHTLHLWSAHRGVKKISMSFVGFYINTLSLAM